MQKVSNKWTQFLSSILFLVLMMAQPVHELSHLHDSYGHSQLDDSAANQNQFLIAQPEHCHLCDFHFSPILEIEFQVFETPYQGNFILKEIRTSFTDFISQTDIYFHNLRAPPSLA